MKLNTIQKQTHYYYYIRNKGTLDYAEEVGDIIVHYDKNGRILLIEILNAGKIIPKLVEALAKREATIPVKTQ
ncbi:MAG: hypothetical protein DRN53_08665 [Thermoprotei archaeon]|nr:MAG: hypothetical protein DRN53_08665 [Thermoprotei archaeon]